MGSRFLDAGNEIEGLSDGSASIFIAEMALSGLSPNFPVRTDSNKKLVSTLLSVADTSTLETRLNEKTTLAYNHTTKPTSPPPVGQIITYAKSDNKLYSLDSNGVEKQISGGGGGSSSTWQFSILTSGTPATGYFLLSNTVPATATDIVINAVDTEGIDRRPILQTLAMGDTVLLSNANGSNTKLYLVSDIIVQPTYYTISVTLEAQSSPATYSDSEAIGVQFYIAQNPFDQSLNTTDDVKFNTIEANNLLTFKNNSDVVASGKIAFNTELGVEEARIERQFGGLFIENNSNGGIYLHGPNYEGLVIDPVAKALRPSVSPFDLGLTGASAGQRFGTAYLNSLDVSGAAVIGSETRVLDKLSIEHASPTLHLKDVNAVGYAAVNGYIEFTDSVDKTSGYIGLGSNTMYIIKTFGGNIELQTTAGVVKTNCPIDAGDEKVTTTYIPANPEDLVNKAYLEGQTLQSVYDNGSNPSIISDAAPIIQLNKTSAGGNHGIDMRNPSNQSCLLLSTGGDNANIGNFVPGKSVIISSNSVGVEMKGATNVGSLNPLVGDTVDLGTGASNFQNLYLSGTANASAMVVNGIDVESNLTAINDKTLNIGPSVLANYTDITGDVAVSGILSAPTLTADTIGLGPGGLIDVEVTLNGLRDDIATLNDKTLNITDSTIVNKTFLSGQILPSVTTTQDIGSISEEWRDAYFSGVVNAGTVSSTFVNAASSLAVGSKNVGDTLQNQSAVAGTTTFTDDVEVGGIVRTDTIKAFTPSAGGANFTDNFTSAAVGNGGTLTNSATFTPASGFVRLVPETPLIDGQLVYTPGVSGPLGTDWTFEFDFQFLDVTSTEGSSIKFFKQDTNPIGQPAPNPSTSDGYEFALLTSFAYSPNYVQIYYNGNTVLSTNVGVADFDKSLIHTARITCVNGIDFTFTLTPNPANTDGTQVFTYSFSDDTDRGEKAYYGVSAINGGAAYTSEFQVHRVDVSGVIPPTAVTIDTDLAVNGSISLPGKVTKDYIHYGFVDNASLTPITQTNTFAPISGTFVSRLSYNFIRAGGMVTYTNSAASKVFIISVSVCWQIETGVAKPFKIGIAKNGTIPVPGSTNGGTLDDNSAYPRNCTTQAIVELAVGDTIQFVVTNTQDTTNLLVLCMTATITEL